MAGRPNKVAQCATGLRILLKDGPVRWSKIYQWAIDNYSDRTLERAKTVLELESIRIGFGRNSVCYWGLPGSGDAFKRKIEGKSDAAVTTATEDDEPEVAVAVMDEPEEPEEPETDGIDFGSGEPAGEDRVALGTYIAKSLDRQFMSGEKRAKLAGSVLRAEKPEELIQEAIKAGHGCLQAMIEIVQKHCSGETVDVPAWQWTETIEVPTMTGRWDKKRSEWVYDVPCIDKQKKVHLSYTPVEGGVPCMVPSNERKLPDDLSKWQTWLALARQQQA